MKLFNRISKNGPYWLIFLKQMINKRLNNQLLIFTKIKKLLQMKQIDT